MTKSKVMMMMKLTITNLQRKKNKRRVGVRIDVVKAGVDRAEALP